jgi:hypothetical protein
MRGSLNSQGTHVPDMVLLATAREPRALIRAQLIEEGFEVVATDSWTTARAFLRPGSKPRLVIVDLQDLPEPDHVLADLQVLMKPEQVLVLAALATVPPQDIDRLGFRSVKRPVSISSIVSAATRAIRSQEVQ